VILNVFKTGSLAFHVASDRSLQIAVHVASDLNKAISFVASVLSASFARALLGLIH